MLLEDGKLATATLIYGNNVGVYLGAILISVVENTGQAGHHLLASHLQAY